MKYEEELCPIYRRELSNLFFTRYLNSPQKKKNWWLLLGKLKVSSNPFCLVKHASQSPCARACLKEKNTAGFLEL